MRSSAIIVSGPAAIALMIFYYFIPFQIVAGGQDWLGRLRPLILLLSVIFIAFGFVGLRRERQAKSHMTTQATLVLTLFSRCGAGNTVVSAAAGKLLGKSIGRLT